MLQQGGVRAERNHRQDQKTQGKRKGCTQRGQATRGGLRVVLTGKRTRNRGGGEPTKTQRSTDWGTQLRNTRGSLRFPGERGQVVRAQLSAPAEAAMALLALVLFQTLGEKSLLLHQESRCRSSLHCLNFCSSILCWILLFELDHSLSNAFS